MITPLGVRQILTTAAMEAVRQGHEGAVQGQLLLAKRQAVLDRMTEAQDEVPNVEGSDELRLNPDNAPKGQGGGGGEASGEAPEETAKGPDEAGPAEGRLDFLA